MAVMVLAGRNAIFGIEPGEPIGSGSSAAGGGAGGAVGAGEGGGGAGGPAMCFVGRACPGGSRLIGGEEVQSGLNVAVDGEVFGNT